MVRSILVAFVLAAAASSALAQGTWPDDAWTDWRTVRTPVVLNEGRAVAAAGDFLFASGFDPDTGEGVVARFRLDENTITFVDLIRDPSPQPRPGFGFRLFATGARLFVADAGYDDAVVPDELFDDPIRAGRVEVFQLNFADDRYEHRQTIESPTEEFESSFGSSIVVNNFTVFIGAPKTDILGVLDAGAVFVFEVSTSSHALEATLLAPSPTPLAQFGRAIEFDGRRVIIGAPYTSGGSQEVGRVFIYDRPDSSDDVWKLVQILDPENYVNEDSPSPREFGFALAVGQGFTKTLAVSMARGNILDRGAVVIFESDNFGGLYEWRAEIPRPMLPGIGASNRYATDLAIENNAAFRRLYVGAGGFRSNAGPVHLFTSTDLDQPWIFETNLPRADGGSIAFFYDQAVPRLFAPSGSNAILYSRDAQCFRDLRADANNDGVTDFQDLNLVLGNFGLEGDDLDADLNNDSVVDFIDLNFVLFTFGSPCLPPN